MLVILSDVELSLTKQQQGTDGTDNIQGKLWSRFRLEEEKIQKMDREYEANRIAEMVQTKKLETDRKQKQAQQQKKAEAMSARQKEKELKQQQMLQAKADAAQQQKILKEAVALSKKTTSAKDEKHEHVGANTSTDVTIKQRQCMMTFLTKQTSVSQVSKYTVSTGFDDHIRPDPSHSVQQQAHPPTVTMIHGAASPEDRYRKQNPQSGDQNDSKTISNRESLRKVFYVDAFREVLRAKTTLLAKDFQNSFSRVNLSTRAKWSRRHRECISVPIFVTVHPTNDDDYDNPFVLRQQQPYAEQVHIKVQNRYKYLSFCENVRPPYYGTWSKRSKFVNGKKPFGIDASQLDYDVDSEGEWEEEEDGIGEEIGNDAMEDDAEKNWKKMKTMDGLPQTMT